MMASRRNLRRTMLLISFSAFVAACGGGGAANTGSPSPLPSPAQPTLPGSGGSVGSDGQTGGSGGSAEAYAVLTWDAPNTNSDNSCLQDLQAYRVNLGLAPGVYTDARTVEATEMSCSPSGQSNACGQVQTCTVMVEDLPSASWYFAIQAIDAAGNVSANSNEMVKTVQ